MSYSEVEDVVAQLCGAYERGQALGSLCPDLCTRHTLGNSVALHQAHPR